jgi:hypothetical protein
MAFDEVYMGDLKGIKLFTTRCTYNPFKIRLKDHYLRSLLRRKWENPEYTTICTKRKCRITRRCECGIVGWFPHSDMVKDALDQFEGREKINPINLYARATGEDYEQVYESHLDINSIPSISIEVVLIGVIHALGKVQVAEQGWLATSAKLSYVIATPRLQRYDLRQDDLDQVLTSFRQNPTWENVETCSAGAEWDPMSLYDEGSPCCFSQNPLQGMVNIPPAEA